MSGRIQESHTPAVLVESFVLHQSWGVDVLEQKLTMLCGHLLLRLLGHFRQALFVNENSVQNLMIK